MRIEIQQGGKKQSYVTRRGSAYVSVGARSTCDVVIDAPGVSDLHLKFEHFAERWSFNDQMSDSGTQQNGETKYSGDLAVGDVLQLGEAKIVVVNLTDERDAEAKQTRVADRSWQEEISLSSKKPTGEYRRERSNEYDAKGKGNSAYDAQQQGGGGYGSRQQQGGEYGTKGQAGGAYDSGSDTDAEYRRSTTSEPVRSPTAKPKAGAKPGNKPFWIIFVLAGVIIAVAGVFNVLARVDSGPDEPGPSPEAAREAADTARMPKELEDQFRKQLRDLTQRSDERPAMVKLKIYDGLKQAIGKFQSHSLGWPLESTYTTLTNQLRREMEQRWSADLGKVSPLTREKKYRAALELMRDLDAFLKQDDLHRQMAELQMQESVDFQLETLADGNVWFISENMATVDEALMRNDFASATNAAVELVNKAELTDDFKGGLAADSRDWSAKARQQAAGEYPARTEPFNRRKDKLPEALKSDLLPKGDASCYSTLNSLRYRLDKAWRAGSLDKAPCVFRGRDAVVRPYDSHDGHMYLEVTHEFASGVSGTYLVRAVPVNLPEQTKATLYEAMNPTRDELLATMMMCFEYGLIDDATRLACKLWHADETVKPDLDQLLATKLGIEVPEGGFIEKDGKLVAPE
ncbi:MAG: FHA domain-containing protein [Planctomycetes bacterium]|nr:FHA domain-containing protein [Planctomycetota bacterium]